MNKKPDPVERLLSELEPPPPPFDLMQRCLITIPVASPTEQEKTTMAYILAVDDEPNIVRLIQVTLERHGYKIDTAKNGAQALSKIRANRPALVVCDVMMPEMDGFELLSTLRRDPLYADLPMLMLTAKVADQSVMEGYSRGADMYLTKPFNPMELVQFVQRILGYQDEEKGRAFVL
jgi:two-component system, OmpR family, alkaline phosphatase synthesis response regulator PhoP